MSSIKSATSQPSTSLNIFPALHISTLQPIPTINLAMHIPTYQPNSSNSSLSQQSCINCFSFSMNNNIIYYALHLLSLQIWTPMMSMAHFEKCHGRRGGGLDDNLLVVFPVSTGIIIDVRKLMSSTDTTMYI